MKPRSPGSTRRSAVAEPVALAALLLDAAVGWPDAVYRRIGHPVGGIARAIGRCERQLNDGRLSESARRALGGVTLVFVVGATGLLAWLATLPVRAVAGDWAWLGLALLAAPGLAQRSLHEHVAAVADALAAGDPAAARAAVARIVGRDVESLDEAGIARAAIESLAESFCDGVVAPLGWLLVAGVPGLWAYKAVNTADSLVGHKEPRWRAFGWAAARSDDVANFGAARLAAVLLCIAGPGGWGTLWRDGGKHASPNAGRPEAAMAGVLRLRLAGPIRYDGAVHDKPWIGDGRADAGAADVRRALSVYRRACLLLWILAGGVAWAP